MKLPLLQKETLVLWGGIKMYVNVQTEILSPNFTLHKSQYKNPLIILCEMLTAMNAALSVPQFIASFLKLRYLISSRRHAIFYIIIIYILSSKTAVLEYNHELNILIVSSNTEVLKM
jgi:hypothetical protein